MKRIMIDEPELCCLSDAFYRDLTTGASICVIDETKILCQHEIEIVAFIQPLATLNRL